MISTRQIKIRFEPVGAQRDFLEDDESKLLHLSAGFGFGKTTTLLYKLLKLSVQNKNYHGGLVCTTYTDFKRDVMPLMDEIADRNNLNIKFHGSDHYYTFPWSKGRLYVATAERKLRGPNWSYAGINELTLIPKIRYQEVIGRVRVKGASNSQIVSSGTPEGIASEYYEIFEEKPWKGSRILYGDTRDNAHNLDSNYIQRLIDTYPAAMLDAYMKGLWVNLQGNRFYFSYDPKINTSDHTPDFDQYFHASLDLNVDPFCIGIWQQFGNQIVAVDEIELKNGEGYDTRKALDAMKARGYTPHNTIIYPDPASQARSTRGQPDFKTMQDYGYQVRVKKSAPRMRERQINVNNLFEKKIIAINRVKCPSLNKDLMAVEQDKITLEKSKKNPMLTHFSDGMDYMIDILYPFNGHKTTYSETRIR